MKTVNVVKMSIDTLVLKAKDATEANKLIVDGITYDICGVREVQPGTLTFFTMIFAYKGTTEYKQFVFNPEDDVEVKVLNIKK